jgi:hypothetical protein
MDMSLLCAVPISLIVAASLTRRRRVIHHVSKLESVSTLNSSLAKRRTYEEERALDAASQLLVR